MNLRSVKNWAKNSRVWQDYENFLKFYHSFYYEKNKLTEVEILRWCKKVRYYRDSTDYYDNIIERVKSTFRFPAFEALRRKFKKDWIRIKYEFTLGGWDFVASYQIDFTDLLLEKEYNKVFVTIDFKDFSGRLYRCFDLDYNNGLYVPLLDSTEKINEYIFNHCKKSAGVFGEGAFFNYLVYYHNSLQSLKDAIKEQTARNYKGKKIRGSVVDNDTALNVRKIEKKFNCKIYVSFNKAVETINKFGAKAVNGKSIEDFRDSDIYYNVLGGGSYDCDINQLESDFWSEVNQKDVIWV